MTTRIAINGFGRIGRLVLRAWLETGRDDIELVAVNDLGSVETNAHLLKYDTVHGVLASEVSAEDDMIRTARGPVAVYTEPDPARLPWGSLGIDIALECTGRFTAYDQASSHLTAGAGRVLISAPGKNPDITVVYGVNDDDLHPDHRVVSNASCTTNCLAPIVAVLEESVGIEHGYMTTIHAYTGDQNTVDSMHQDLRRARGAAQSIIPTSTGAAKAVGLVLPKLAGKIDGCAMRVPTPNVSLVDFAFTSARDTDSAQINHCIMTAAQGSLSGVLAVNEQPLVSIDFNHNPASSVFDATQTQVLGCRFCRIVAWYDNEWGFSNRMLDTAAAMGRLPI